MTRPDRIPIAIALRSFDAGGTERQMSALIERLDQTRFDVHVACLRREGPWLAGVERAVSRVDEFRVASFASPSAVAQAIRFARWCRRHRIAVLHTCDLPANVFALPAGALAGVPLRIGSRRGIAAPDGNTRMLRLQAAAYRLAHGIVANSHAAAEAVARDGVPWTRIRIVPNGIDIGVYARAPLATPRRVVTTVANLRPIKGHDTLLQAAAAVVSARPDVVFQFAGDGPRRSALEARARSLGIERQVRFLGQCSDVAGLLRSSDLFVLPSLMEAFPNALMEAMATGLPVVATKVGGIPELVEHDRNGLLVPPGRPDELAAAILALLENPARADQLASAARRTVEQRYSFDQMVQAIESIYTGGVPSPAALATAM
jgi:glycosyltransferase involved in cell wall biosynthesis